MRDDAEVLGRLRALLWLFGTANDAEDHNCGPEALQLRQRAATEIHELMREHPFVVEVLPGLERELETGHIEGFGWSNLVDALDRGLGRWKLGSNPPRG